MTPTSTGSQQNEVLLPLEGKQSLFIVRHGDRYDYQHKDWIQSSTRPGDPPLSSLGLQQARETGAFLDSLLSSEGLTAEDVTWMSSPFLRCLQTSHGALDAFKKTKDSEKLSIHPEYSIFEWDGYNGKLHESLPTLDERKHYFPRLDMNYESLFIPGLPEPRSAFHDRCAQSVKAIGQRYRYRPGTALVAVTHAAACIYMAAIASNQTADQITPAAPCSIYRLTRTSDTAVWTIDPHDAVNSMNGQTSHLSDMGVHTVPWHNFADKTVFSGYTGPETSRFAPKGYTATSRDEL